MEEPAEGGEGSGGVVHVVEDDDGVLLGGGGGEGEEEVGNGVRVGGGVEGVGEVEESSIAGVGGVVAETGSAGAVRVDPNGVFGRRRGGVLEVYLGGLWVSMVELERRKGGGEMEELGSDEMRRH